MQGGRTPRLSTANPDRFRLALLPALLAACGLGGAGCAGCDGLSASEDGLQYTRCAAVPAQEDAQWTLPGQAWRVHGRQLTVEAAEGVGLDVVAFTGALGRPPSKSQMETVRLRGPDLALMVGGLGLDEVAVTRHLAALQMLEIPVIFVPGGTDRHALYGPAFARLEPSARARLIDASGFRVLSLAGVSFALLPGAPGPRYALDGAACAYGDDDIEALAEHLERRSDVLVGAKRGPPSKLNLLAWSAPSGWGLTISAGGVDVGDPRLERLAGRFALEGGLFVYPETGVFGRDAARSPAGMPRDLLPRFGRGGARRADGSARSSGLLWLRMDRGRWRRVSGP